jgi:hypothetical protein
VGLKDYAIIADGSKEIANLFSARMQRNKVFVVKWFNRYGLR